MIKLLKLIKKLIIVGIAFVLSTTVVDFFRLKNCTTPDKPIVVLKAEKTKDVITYTSVGYYVTYHMDGDKVVNTEFNVFGFRIPDTMMDLKIEK